jgi:hypothetical protein
LVGADLYVDRASWLVVVDRILNDVGQEYSDQLFVARDGRRVQDDVRMEVPRVNGRAAEVEFLLGNLRQIDRLVLVNAALAAGQGEERLDEPLVVFASGEDVLAGGA